MTVIAPKGGYDFAEKRQYRRHVWNTVARTSFIDPKRAQIMLMPSLEGDEIDAAKAKGFRVSNMHVVDASPAVIATLRRRDYGPFTGYGRMAADACTYAASQGVRLDAANFDFTSCMCDSLMDELRAIGRSGVFRRQCMIGVTVQRGREVGGKYLRPADEWDDDKLESFTRGRSYSGWRHMGIPLTQRDYARLFAASAGLMFGFLASDGALPGSAFIASGTYKSNRVTMLWCVMAFVRHSTQTEGR